MHETKRVCEVVVGLYRTSRLFLKNKISKNLFSYTVSNLKINFSTNLIMQQTWYLVPQMMYEKIEIFC